jgi:putative copper export protein/methionine-rich copper-binding protein CopC
MGPLRHFYVCKRWPRALLLALLTLLALASASGMASAHGYLVRAVPADRVALDRAPARLQYWFSESLEPEFSRVRVRNTAGVIIAEGGVAEDNRTQMTVRLPSGLPEGAYVVELRPAFADGHVQAESRVFFVGAAIGDVAAGGLERGVRPLEVIWRAALLPSVFLLFGVFTLYSAVLIPAWGSARYPAGGLPPRVINRLSAVIAAALIAAFAANILALIEQTMAFFNVDFARALDPALWSVVRMGSRFGDVWNARLIFLAIAAVTSAASLYLRRDQPGALRPLWTANAWVLALVIGSFSVVSHAAGSTLWPWVGVAIDWLHATAVGFWIGGLMALILALPPALRSLEGEDRRRALLAVLRRFSRIAAVMLALVIASGVYSATNWIDEPDDLTTTQFGGALMVKLLLAAGLIAVAGLHHVVLRADRYPRLARALRIAPGSITPGKSGSLASLRLEVILALATLASVGVLSASPIPVPESAEREIAAPSATVRGGDLAVTLTVSPGGPGINTYDVQVTRGGDPVDGLDVSLLWVDPSRDWRGDPQPAEPIDAGLYAAAGDEIARAGEWWTLIDVVTATGETIRAAYEWQIDESAAVQQTRAPSLVNALALMGVVLTIAWALTPAARRAIDWLDLSPASVTIAAGATAVTIAALILAGVILGNTTRRYEERRNPLPQVVNAVLPDQASIDRGQALYEQSCLGWQAAGRDFTALRDNPAIRDETIYAAITSGWRSLPPCEDDLSEDDRWHVVNFFRTLGRESG